MLSPSEHWLLPLRPDPPKTPLLTYCLTCLYFTAPVWEKQRWRRPGEIREGFMRHSLVPPQALGPYSSPGPPNLPTGDS